MSPFLPDTFRHRGVSGRLISHSLLMLALLAVAISAGCESDPVGPGIGSGDELTATVNGTPLEFELTSGGTSYNATTFYGIFHGQAGGSVVRSLQISFISDIGSADPYPRVVRGPNANFTYIEIAGGDTTIYNCNADPVGCAVTLTASNGSIVDGTFSVTLTASSGSRQVTLTNGRFSVKVR